MSGTTNLGIPFIQAAQNQKEVTANAAFEALDASANAAISIAMGDANIALTDAQALRAGLITLTGSNTAVRKVTLPSKARRLAIQNSTGGALDITVGYATGATVTVGNGAIVLVQGNGTNCYGVGGAAALGDLADVAGPFLNGDLLQFDGSAWRPIGTGILSRVMLPFKGALVRRATTATLTATATALAFTDATYDTDGFWSGAAPTRLTVPAGVTKVRLWARISWTGGSANHGARIFRNGASFVGQADFIAASGYTNADVSLVSAVVAVTPGDYFEILAFTSANRTSVANGLQFGIEVVETADAANPTLLTLTDTPASYAGAAGKLLQVNGAASAIEFGPKHNLAASTAPTATDDSAAGFGVGSQWLDTVGDKIWFCTDATAGAAVWKGVTIA